MAPSLDAFCLGVLEDLERRGLARRLARVEGPCGARIRLGGREVINLGSNDYLGLAGHPEVRAAARQALDARGAGAGGARLVCGNRPEHEELESFLAQWKGAEAALLFNTGYMANVGLIPALAGPGDLVLSDALNHASIIDGCRLSRAEVRVYRHADPDEARATLAAERHRFRHCLVVTDGVFSMDGDLAPLGELAALAERYEAWLVVDDAHGTGVLGATGAGTVEHLGVGGRVPVQMGTLSKAVGVEGGFVAGSRPLAAFLRHRARSFVFSTAMPPATAAAALAAARLARTGAERRAALARNAALLRQGLQSAGYRVPAGETPIIPVLVGDPGRALALSAALLERGVFAPAIRPPAVPEGQSRLRVTASAAHSAADLAEALEAFRAAGQALGLI